MKISEDQIKSLNAAKITEHQTKLAPLKERLELRGFDTGNIIRRLRSFQVAIPSWALGTGGTRFGRFPGGGEPRSLEEKLEDIGLLNTLNQSSGAVSLHIPWDIPEDPEGTRALADDLGIKFDAVNSNTFQDQPGEKHSYKFGSLSHVNKDVRAQAIAHNKEVIDYGAKLGSKALTVWLADGSSFPGQNNFMKAFSNTKDSLESIYDHMPDDWKMLIEYKPYEPNFYSMVIPDWGTSHLLATKLGQRAYSLVDLGHHLPNTNIEQIVALLMHVGKLGGFHFNDSKYGDDDLTVGSLKPYQLMLIFNELVLGLASDPKLEISWMIDASHNLKDPLEDLIQSVEAIKIAYAQALIIDHKLLQMAQESNDVTLAQEILQDAFRTDVRPLLAEASRESNGSLHPLLTYRKLKVREHLIKERGNKTYSTGL
ncbi:sugar isomerase [Fulvivirga sp. M361]|uniref:TIM barrel protein n=1 Tax=Fulvivirga sp. M361 TaxID=2594266 RepID=UPI001179DA8A|nr:TIM barrel protein [Fulvivirga sp. M361]TRX46325.1 sugar isomerase [Fulvivirga sp. M361]